MDSALERALAQAESDVTFKKVKRMSYSSNAAGEVSVELTGELYSLLYYRFSVNLMLTSVNLMLYYVRLLASHTCAMLMNICYNNLSLQQKNIEQII